MKFGSDKIKYPGRIFALIFLCAALILLYFLVAADKNPADTAEELMADGRYTEAAQLYLEAGDDDMYQRCLIPSCNFALPTHAATGSTIS